MSKRYKILRRLRREMRRIYLDATFHGKPAANTLNQYAALIGVKRFPTFRIPIEEMDPTWQIIQNFSTDMKCLGRFTTPEYDAAVKEIFENNPIQAMQFGDVLERTGTVVLPDQVYIVAGFDEGSLKV